MITPFAGGAWKWVGFSPLNEFSIKAMAVSIDACQKHEVDDYLVTLWGDDGAEASLHIHAITYLCLTIIL